MRLDNLAESVRKLLRHPEKLAGSAGKLPMRLDNLAE